MDLERYYVKISLTPSKRNSYTEPKFHLLAILLCIFITHSWKKDPPLQAWESFLQKGKVDLRNAPEASVGMPPGHGDQSLFPIKKERKGYGLFRFPERHLQIVKS